MEKCREKRLPLYMCFIDYTKAFDCIDHEQLWSTLSEMNFPKHIIYLAKQLYSNQKAAIRLKDGTTRWFQIERGVRQGCILSPHFFGCVGEAIMRRAMEGKDEIGVILNCPNGTTRRVRELRYADDTVLLAHSPDELNVLIQSVKQESEMMDLKLNPSKTKIMISNQDQSQPVSFAVDGVNLEQISSFQYLGSTLSDDAKCVSEIKKRVAMGREVFMKMSNLLKDRQMPMKLRVRLLNTLVMPVIGYGAESWTLNADLSRRIDAVEMWLYRRMLRISWQDKVTNENVLIRAGVPELHLRKSLVERKLSYFGHVCRHPGLDQDCVLGIVPGKRGRGRPPLQWIDTIKKGYGSVQRAVDLASERQTWRRSTRVTAVHVD